MISPPSTFSGSRPLLRFDRPAEWPTIRTLLDTVFGDSRESELIERLRKDGDLLFLIIAVHAERIIGVVGFSRLRIDGPAPINAATLAPLAVAPDMRGQGVGSALVSAGLTHARKKHAQAVCVLGHERYFRRFGFTALAAEKIAGPWSGPNFMALSLSNETPPLVGEAVYPTAFTALAESDDEDDADPDA